MNGKIAFTTSILALVLFASMACLTVVSDATNENCANMLDDDDFSEGMIGNKIFTDDLKQTVEDLRYDNTDTPVKANASNDGQDNENGNSVMLGAIGAIVGLIATFVIINYINRR